jgi:DNA-binding Lrp family transcriptional regulator
MTDTSGALSPLSVLGFTGAQEELYRVVLRNSGIAVAELSQLLGMPAKTVAEDVARFASLGLLDLRGDSVVALPPDHALGRLITEETRRLHSVEEQLGSLRRMLPSLSAEHRSSQAPRGEQVTVEILGGDDVIDLVRSLSPTSQGDLLWMRPDQWRYPEGPLADEWVKELVRSGRRSRAIYPARALEEAPRVIRGRAAAGEHVRVLADIPFRAAVLGDSAAILADRLDRAPHRALVLRQGLMIRALQLLFETLWDKAMPVPGMGGASDGTSDRALLLDQLASGAKDEQIARALGISLRTVRRRVAEVLEELGAGSRFQAGVEAVRRGWV